MVIVNYNDICELLPGKGIAVWAYCLMGMQSTLNGSMPESQKTTTLRYQTDLCKSQNSRRQFHIITTHSLWGTASCPNYRLEIDTIHTCYVSGPLFQIRRMLAAHGWSHLFFGRLRIGLGVRGQVEEKVGVRL